MKHRIGIDAIDRYEDMVRFVEMVRPSGADRFTVHARKAWLQGLSPRENRDIPPLDYDRVYRLKAARPELPIIINGGTTTFQMVHFLVNRRMPIFTNSFPIAEHLLKHFGLTAQDIVKSTLQLLQVGVEAVDPHNYAVLWRGWPGRSRRQ